MSLMVSRRQEVAKPAFPPVAVPPFRRGPRGRGVLALGFFTTFVLVGGFGTWSATAPLAEAAVAPGIIKVEGQRRTLQHLEGGIIREILVRDGDRVRPGQVIMRLDDVQAVAGFQTQRVQQLALLAHVARVESEMAGHDAIVFPPELLAATEPAAIEAREGQRDLFLRRRAALTSQLATLQARLDQANAQIQSATGLLAGTRRQLDLIRQEEQMRRVLVNQGLSRLPDLLAIQRSLAGLEASVADQEAQIQRGVASRQEAEHSIRSTLDTRQQELSSERRDLAVRLAETETRLRVAADFATRRDLVAPEAGTIVNSRFFTVGGVVRPGDEVMDLVPGEDRLVAEVHVQPMDIDVVRPGLSAEIRLPAFKQRLMPFLSGEVLFVAADVQEDTANRQRFYRAHISIEPSQLGAMRGAALVPGMPVEAHIQTGQRTFWTYLTQPLRESMRRAFIEQ